MMHIKNSTNLHISQCKYAGHHCLRSSSSHQPQVTTYRLATVG